MESFLPILFAVLLALTAQISKTNAHGRMMNPPARNVMWRVGFPCPVNYNDNEQYCGGIKNQWELYFGKCGMCGDPYGLAEPRPHETGGKFGLAIITRRYYSGQIISLLIELTANHKGYFMFRICSIKHYVRECVDQETLNRNVLPIVHPNGTLIRKYVLETLEKKATIELKALLPPGFNCTRCVLQWTYTTGNSWGTCEDGSQAMGCGKQETFVNCADVQVNPVPFSLGPKNRELLSPHLTSTSRCNPYRKYYRDMTRSGAPMKALAVRYQVCVSKHTEDPKNPGPFDTNCQNRCLQYPPECPKDMCKCIKDVKARDWFAEEQDMADQWCLDRCNVHPIKDTCDFDKCEIVYTRTID